MSKFFIAAALGLGLLSAGTAANAGPVGQGGPQMGAAVIGATPVQYRGGPHYRHYAPPPPRPHHRYAPPPPRRHYGWQAPRHQPPRQYGWR